LRGKFLYKREKKTQNKKEEIRGETEKKHSDGGKKNKT